jgi:shikimate 5-dehydrogenase
MYFVGVSTHHSSIMKLFPLWMEELGRPDIRLGGMDLKLHDDPENYRRAVTLIKEDPACLGALVTAHKINLLNAARDLFDYLDPLAQMSGEVSCISKFLRVYRRTRSLFRSRRIYHCTAAAFQP